MEFFNVRITESFNRVLENKNVRLFLEAEGDKYKFVVKNGTTEVSFDAEPDASLADNPYVAFCDTTGSWRNVGLISSRMRVVANLDSFDQLRSNMIKAKDVTRKANFPAWDKGAANGRTAPTVTKVLKRPALPPKKRAVTTVSRPSIPKASKELNAQKAREKYQRIIEVIEGAKKRRVELENRLSAVHADASLSETDKRTAISAIEEDIDAFVKELLANKDLVPTIPGTGVTSDSRISLGDYLRHLRDLGASSTASPVQ